MRSGFASTVAASRIEMALKSAVVMPLMKALQSMMQGFAGGAGGIPTMAMSGFGHDIPASMFHRGGTVGIDGQPRYVHPAYFDDAPRFHRGTLAPDERAAILQTGEHVLSREDVAALRGGTGGDAPGPVVNVYAPPGLQVETRENRGQDGGPVGRRNHRPGGRAQPRDARQQLKSRDAHDVRGAAGTCPPMNRRDRVS
ncbi:MAG TPA: hypothetical protein VGU45_12285 [Microvirga sp.]|jgi:hypothetical protein|nr:hypothetical protein [Microvirga sp.]